MRYTTKRVGLGVTVAIGLFALTETAVQAQDVGEGREPTPIARGFENLPFPVRVPRGLY